MTDLTKQLLNYGIGGLFLLALIIAIIYLVKWHREREKEHKEEREQFAKVIEKQFEEANKRDTENKTILTSLKVLLETLHK